MHGCAESVRLSTQCARARPRSCQNSLLPGPLPDLDELDMLGAVAVFNLGNFPE
jgi:hypothetical protein